VVDGRSEPRSRPVSLDRTVNRGVLLPFSPTGEKNTLFLLNRGQSANPKVDIDAGERMGSVRRCL